MYNYEKISFVHFVILHMKWQAFIMHVKINIVNRIEIMYLIHDLNH